MDLCIVPVTEREAERTAAVADRTWRDSYSGIISDEQIEYMLRKFQSAEEIGNRVDMGDGYFLLTRDGMDIGYFCIVNEGERMFLSKIYIDAPYQRMGMATYIIDHVCGICRRDGISAVYLTVNRRNAKAIGFYRSYGFDVVDDVIKDIGNGFVMDDHVMELRV